MERNHAQREHATNVARRAITKPTAGHLEEGRKVSGQIKMQRVKTKERKQLTL